jgi:trehalose 6-phosphate phosphatase
MIPHALDRLEEWRAARRQAGRLLLALDFDGTLAPIVEWPEQATLLPAAREALLRLARRPDTDLAIVSGRTLEDVRARVALPGVYYAGNHGMEIEGPGVQRRFVEAAAVRPRLAACAEALRHALAGVEGAFVEDKGLTLSVHYRRVAEPALRDTVRRIAQEACGREPGLRLTEGKMISEIRPDVDWDKGRALRFLLDALEAGDDNLVPALFIGDDRTDEDGFRALAGRGDGILVADPPPPTTAATAYLRSPDEVAQLLAGLADPD